MISFTTSVLPSTILEVDVQAHQKMQAPLTPDMLFTFIHSGKTWACCIDEKPVALGGILPTEGGRAVLWGLLGAGCGKAMPAMTKKVKKELAELRVVFTRIEAYTVASFEAGNRWLELLGFEREGVARKFYNGVDYSVYAMVT